MADYSEAFATGEWPLAKFYFRVTIDGMSELGFQAVEGLESEISVMEYRPGNSPLFFKSKRYGMMTFSNITLKKGMFATDAELKDWWDLFAWQHEDRSTRRAILIELLDEKGDTKISWDVKGCFPAKFTPTSLDAEADSEVAIEELEVICESWTVEIA